MDDLRECPFCGGEAVLDNQSFHYKVGCDNLDCPVLPATNWFKTIEEAITEWDTRATDALLDECREAWDIFTHFIEVTSLKIDIQKRKETSMAYRRLEGAMGELVAFTRIDKRKEK